MSVLTTSDSIGAYRVQSLITSNYYTETYRVVDSDDHPFFLKLFIVNRLPYVLLNPESKKVREIEYCQLLNHRNLVNYVADGAFERESGSYQYYVTGYFSGELLADHLRTSGPLSEEKALKVFRSLLVGLQYMHSQSPALCHNDITPRNILLSDTMDGEAVLIDMGHTSKPCSGMMDFDTNDLDVLYHAKETMVGIFDEQSDIFSACATFYAMLTGQAPWVAELPWDRNKPTTRDYKTRFKVIWQYRQSHPLDLSDLNVSNKTKYIIEHGLALKATDRFASVSDIIAIIDDHEPTPEKEPEGTKRAESGQGSKGDGGKTEGGHGDENDIDIDIRRGDGNGFQDIAGMQELKDYLKQKVIFVIQNKELAEEYRITPPNGMLLYGPPGCGKTFFAEKFAEETGFNFMLIKSSDIGSTLVHGTEAKIKQLFEKAEKNSPIVLCFDEFDALVPVRGAHGSEYVSSEVNEFLAQMNNCAKRGIFIIATSNRPDKIDPAILRTGRIDKQVFVPLPDFEARKEMFKMYLAKRPTTEDVNVDEYAKNTEGYIASDIAFIVNDAAMTAAFARNPISHSLLCTSISNIKPSLQKEVLDEYSEIQSKMNGLQRRAVVQSL